MKKLLVLLIMGVFAVSAFAQDGSISGFVKDANTSAPIMGAQVLALGPDSGWAYTDSSGTYQVSGLTPGCYSVIASASGYESATNDSIIVFAGQNTPNVNFWLQPSGGPQYGSISGFVYDTTTALPIIGAHVVAEGPGWGDAYTDSSGAYLITDLDEGTYAVTASASGYESATNYNIIVTGGQNTPDVNFWLFPGGGSQYGSISGFVYDATDSMPIPSSHVIALGPSWGDAYTDSVGSYQITELLEGWYVVEASAPGYEPGAQDTVIVIAGQNTGNVNFFLCPSGGSNTGISGLVTNAYNNNPILGALVVATDSGSSGQDNTNYYGEYFIEDLAAGFYFVSASAQGFVPAVYPESVEVIDGQITNDIDFALIPQDTIGTGGISGAITNATNAYPVPFAQVYASGSNGQGQACAGSLGIYLISDLDEGKYEVRAAASGYYPATYPESVVVSAGQITLDIDFALVPTDTCGLAGFIIDGETGLTISNAQITATGPSGTIQVMSNNIGDYLVDDLANGVYHIDIQATGYDPVSYPDAILVLSGWVTSFICPVLYPPYAVREHSPDQATRISLYAVPSPFKRESKVSWHINKETNAQLEVIDVSGRVIRNLLNASLKPGSYSATWNGLDEGGNKVAGGVYFYMLETDDANATLKTIFLLD